MHSVILGLSRGHRVGVARLGESDAISGHELAKHGNR